MIPTFINTELTDKEQNSLISLVNKSFSNSGTFSFESWPTYNIVHFKTSTGWRSIMVDKKGKVIKVSEKRETLGKIKVRLDIYADKRFIISHTFNDSSAAKKHAQYHLDNQKEEGYSNSFREKLRYSLNNIVKI